MSSTLYRLGRFVARHRWQTLGVWLLILLVSGGAAFFSGGKLDDAISIPGTEAQDGIEVLSQRFPEFAGVSGVVVFHTTDGSNVASHRDQIGAMVDEIAALDGVAAATDPFGTDAPMVSEDGATAVSNVQLDQPAGSVPPELVTHIQDAVDTIGTGGTLEAYLGGNILQITSVHVGPSEMLGVALALVVLVVTFTSLLAAGMPIIAAILGVAISMLLLLAAAALATINSSTPTLAIMIGLAVGIDYSLFILSRHRSQLAEGMDSEESIARSVATSGSAVVFAGLTVIIALVGLAVAGIPFLAIMGLAAAGAVAIAVAVALTATPALMAVAGERLRPTGKRARRLAVVGPDDTHTMGARWVAAVTRWPVVTIIVVVAALAALALPARDLKLGLPDAGSQPVGTSQRTAYDLITDGFGPGYNAPLLVTADIIRTTDPLTVVGDLADEIRQLPGVQAVGIATPNRTADLAVISVIPEGGRTDQRTIDLIHEIRDMRSDLENRYDITDLRVTGMTAAAIDVSQRLGDALLPFALFVVGFSFILLMIVFRSIAVPIKATLGYLMSVLAAFGGVVAVFIWGHGAEWFGVDRTGPVISFLPIILMGVLFGLAMDYEVFLVSRMREDYVHTGNAQHAIRSGFTSGARVVAAAAIIMISVFAGFIPEGDSIIKPIAFGLALGVFIDAFAVRMTLVPAVMALLGDKAWWLPKGLEKRLPLLDVEGAALEHHLEHEDWTAQQGEARIRMENVRLADHAGVVVDGASAVVRPGQVLVVRGEDLPRRALLSAIAGQLRIDDGRLVVLDRILPDEAGYVRSHSRLVTTPDELTHALNRPLPALLIVDDAAADAPELTALDGTTLVVGLALDATDPFADAVEVTAGTRQEVLA